MSEPNSAVPHGYCQCGCGRNTTISKSTCTREGRVKGQPVRFIWGHSRRKKDPLTAYQEEDRGFGTSCWIWTRHVRDDGYPLVFIGQRMRRAYVFFYEQAKGPVPEGLELDHLCRVKECVNPDHLEAVPHALNVQRGSLAKLNSSEVKEIRRLYATGRYVQEQLAQRYGVTRSAISDITRFKTWRH